MSAGSKCPKSGTRASRLFYPYLATFSSDRKAFGQARLKYFMNIFLSKSWRIICFLWPLTMKPMQLGFIVVAVEYLFIIPLKNYPEQPRYHFYLQVGRHII